MTTYEIKDIEISKIKPYEKNSRIHSSHQVKQIMDSILEFGFTNPLIIDQDYNLIAGHGRLEAVKQLNKVELLSDPVFTLPCVIVRDLSEIQRKALVIADNKIAENAEWNIDILKDEMQILLDSNFDITCTGFDGCEITELLEEIVEEPLDDKPTDARPPIEIRPNEHLDYIVFFFDKDMDFARVCDYFGIRKVDGSMSPKTKKIGIGRALKGERLVDVLDRL